MPNKKTDIQKKENLLEIIENDSSKEDFINWILNNTGATIASTDEWGDIKKKVLKDKKILASALRDYSITLKNGDDVTDALENVREETDKAREVVEKLNFIGYLGKFVIAVGGIILFLAFFNIAVALMIFFRPEFFNILNESIFVNSLGVFLGFSGLVQIMGGLLLMTK